MPPGLDTDFSPLASPKPAESQYFIIEDSEHFFLELVGGGGILPFHLSFRGQFCEDLKRPKKTRRCLVVVVETVKLSKPPRILLLHKIGIREAMEANTGPRCLAPPALW